ncbi:hypothetical protein QJS10_CPA06g00193 [Acorus calamus]|uniref:Uncharacterized protein n=1 Tax=Acorus calamus TaxID=4465 RepID=A0AAV9EM57_ACOCL|nr:hypothetical protein QJS10_CPA06g00193 [Acorus calamus]
MLRARVTQNPTLAVREGKKTNQNSLRVSFDVIDNMRNSRGEAPSQGTLCASAESLNARRNRRYTASPPIQDSIPNQPHPMSARRSAGRWEPRTPKEACSSTGKGTHTSRPGVRKYLLSTINHIEEAEVKRVVFGAEGDKAPGSDSFTYKFCQSCWSTVKAEVLEVFDELFQGGPPKCVSFLPYPEGRGGGFVPGGVCDSTTDERAGARVLGGGGRQETVAHPITSVPTTSDSDGTIGSAAGAAPRLGRGVHGRGRQAAVASLDQQSNIC